MGHQNKAGQEANTEEPREEYRTDGPRQGAAPTGAHEAITAPPVTAGRITVALGRKAVDDLEKARQTTGYSKTDIVNRAISMYAFVEEELQEDAEFLVRRKDGTQYILKSY